MDSATSVQVAVRIRPLVVSEVSKGCQDVLEVYPELEQIRMKNSDKSFTFNYVLSSLASQNELYNRCVQGLIGKIFKGYNVTILAYGQTGSGKTYSMGTTYNGHGEMGIIPRAVDDMFEHIRDQFSCEFFVSVSFMELYQEVIYDLLSDKPRDQCSMDIREDPAKGLFVQGLTEVSVRTSEDVLKLLHKGSLGRATGSTNMNANSSRSHAVFTINVAMQNKENLDERKVARFTLVDLAGSERSKKTGAVGTTFKEGININKGLLVLGNVISCLGDEKQQHGHIPYRDSNLTRLLKDSLGGNSITLMIACVSPADYNMEETLSTLRYADRARKIKNKPIINQDSKAAEIIELRKTIQQLKLQIIGQGGPGKDCEQFETIQKDNLECHHKIKDLTYHLSSVLNDNTALHERILSLQTTNESLCKRLASLKEEYNTTMNNITANIDSNNIDEMKVNFEKLQVIQQQFTDVQNEVTQCEIRSNEDTFVVQPENSLPLEPEISDRQAMYAKEQMVLRNQLEGIDKGLMMKELLAKQIRDNNQNLIDYTGLAKNEEKINQLTKEKEELLQQLRNIHSKEGCNKLAERRRKRVQELEGMITELKKKVQGQARLIKLKEKDEIRIQKLNKEITEMKHDKIQLIKKMRGEADRFRMWRQERERELVKLKHEDRKKNYQIVKMEAINTKQKNVLKRKMEEVAAVNKRLKDALTLSRQVQEQRLGGGKVERVNNWLKQELELFMNIVEADCTMHDLLEDRATLQQHLDQIKSAPEPDINEIKSVQEDIEMRSLQIQDLQQKVLDFNEDNKAKTRWEKIQGMAEAKAALKTLWELTSDIKKEGIAATNQCNEFQHRMNELNEKVRVLEEENKSFQQRHAQDVDLVQKEQGEKVGILLNMLVDKGLEASDPCLRMYASKTRQLEEENRELTNRLEIINEALANANKQLEARVPLESPEKRVTIKVTKVKKSKPKTDIFTVPNDKENLILDSSTEYEEDDVEQDPDWRKTPLGKRVMERRKLLMKEKFLLPGVKRTSDGNCSCTKNCSSRCSCMKSSRSCSSVCRCPEDCVNKPANSTFSNSNELVGDGDGDDDLKKPRMSKQKLFPMLEPPARKKGRSLFEHPGSNN